MSKWAWIEGDTVRETVALDPQIVFTPEVAANFVSCDDELVAGSRLVDGEWVAPPPPPPASPYVPPVPEEISDRQFAQQLAIEGDITQEEALAWVKTGDLPASVSALVGMLPAEDQFGANMLLSGATIYQRHHEMTAVFAQMYGWDDEKIDQVWRDASQL